MSGVIYHIPFQLKWEKLSSWSRITFDEYCTERYLLRKRDPLETVNARKQRTGGLVGNSSNKSVWI